MQYKVPQNIDIEDQVIGPLTLRQFLYLLVGTAVLVTLKFALADAFSFLFPPLLIIIGGFVLALAFYRPGERSFEVYLASIFTTLSRPKKRIWKKEPYIFTEEKKEKTVEKPAEKVVTSEDLEKLAFLVDSGGYEEELKSKGLITSMQVSPKLSQSGALEDKIAPSEKQDVNLNAMLDQAKENISSKKTEPTVQEIASVNPTKTFKYENIANDDSFVKNYEDTLELAQKRQEERYEEAKITR